MAKKRISKGRSLGPRNAGTPYQSVKNAEGKEDFPKAIRMQETKSLEGQKPFAQLKEIKSQQEIKATPIKPETQVRAINTLKSSTSHIPPDRTVKPAHVEKGVKAIKALKKDSPAVKPPTITKKPPTPGR